MEDEAVYFKSIKENRGKYFVEYSPPHHSSRLAYLSLVYLGNSVDRTEVALNMEKEMDEWLGKYPVPLMVTAFDQKGDMIRLKEIKQSNHLIGYVGKESKKKETFWRLLKDEEIPDVALDQENLKRAYTCLPYKTKSQIAKDAKSKARETRIIARIIVAWAVLPTVFILIVGWRNPMVGGILILLGVLKALERTLKLLGKWKGFPWERVREEEEQLKEHHHYHCKQNPEGFNRLKCENFECWEREEIQREAREIRSKNNNS